MTLELKRKAFSSDYDLYEDGELFVGRIEKQINKGVASGYASLDSTTKVPIAQMASGTPDGTKFIRDDRTLQTIFGGGDMLKSTYDPNLDGIIALAQLDPLVCSESEADSRVSTHSDLTTGVHGVGASTIASVANIATHAALSASVHGVSASGFEDKVNKAVASGYCPLDENVLVPEVNIPAGSVVSFRVAAILGTL